VILGPLLDSSGAALSKPHPYGPAHLSLGPEGRVRSGQKRLQIALMKIVQGWTKLRDLAQKFARKFPMIALRLAHNLDQPYNFRFRPSRRSHG
jgi:hypothetical protein